MTCNLMEQYVKNTKSFLKSFTKIFFAEKYNEKISDEFISTYIDSRIYSYGEAEQRFFYRRIYASLVKRKKELEKEFPKLDEKIFEDNLRLYQFIFYIDGVRPIGDLDEFVRLICASRKIKFDVKDAIKNFQGRVLKAIKDYEQEKENFFKPFETTDFELDIEKYTLIDNTYKVDIKYNFKIPYIYSNKVINEVFNEGIIKEDKLIIEYTLLTMVCIKDINKGNFTTKYLVEFANTLLKKQSKLKQTLKTINNSAIQDKVFLKITYQDFEENKELIYDLMKDGYRFAIILDDTFNPTLINLRKLSIFKYMLVPDTCKNYNRIQDVQNKLSNTVIYDI